MHPLTIVTQMTAKGLTLATAESCTGGLIANTLTNISGASKFFMGGIIAYSNQSKTTFLEVAPQTIDHFGAVSKPTAKAMAEGARKRFKTDLALSTTGIAGPTGGTREKPVGLVFIALASAKQTTIKKFLFKGTRLSIKTQACQTALKLLDQAIRRIK